MEKDKLSSAIRIRYAAMQYIHCPEPGTLLGRDSWNGNSQPFFVMLKGDQLLVGL